MMKMKSLFVTILFATCFSITFCLGEHPLPNDGSQPPSDCTEGSWNNHPNGWGFIRPHEYNCSRFWKCEQPDHSHPERYKLFECAHCNPDGHGRCMGRQALTMDIDNRAGPTCNWPDVSDADCSSTPAPTQTPTRPPRTTLPPTPPSCDCNSGVCDVRYSPHKDCEYCNGNQCEPGCLTDEQCPLNLKCGDNHQCICGGGGFQCCSDSDCGPCSDCNELGSCAPWECCEDSDCPTCSECNEGTCSPPLECCDDNPCSCGVTSQCNDGSCQKWECCGDDDCGPCSDCNELGTCSTPLECCDANPCGPCSDCNDLGSCVPWECCEDSHCPTCSECNEGTCSPPLECCDDNPCNCGDPSQCNEGSCDKWECCVDADCIKPCQGQDYNCNSDKKCECYSPGLPVVRNMIIRTETCDHCDASNEGTVVFLKGINTPQGYRVCTTGVLDHDGQQDYVEGGQVEFGGKMDEDVCGGCYKYQLGGEVRAGNITWKGSGEWKGASICVQWDPTERMDVNCNINAGGTLEGCTEVCTCKDLTDDSCEMKKWWNRFF